MLPSPPLEQQIYAGVFPSNVKKFVLLHEGTKQESETVLVQMFSRTKTFEDSKDREFDQWSLNTKVVVCSV